MEAKVFWRGIWGERKKHHKDTEELKNVKLELEKDEDQDRSDITKDEIMAV